MQKPTILLIDDCEMMRRFITLFLSEKYDVTSCESAESALRLIESGWRPRLVITDLDLPGMLGLELIHNFQLTMPYTPLIVVSSATDSNTRLEALKAGADDFLTKPFHPAELAVRAGKLLRQGEKQPATMQQAPGFGGAFRRVASMLSFPSVTNQS